jgi:hypothetical protein
MLAKTLVQIRGGPEALIGANKPQRTTFGGGILVSTPRLLLETLAVYDTFGMYLNFAFFGSLYRWSETGCIAIGPSSAC